jgi:hypothetical protein
MWAHQVKQFCSYIKKSMSRPKKLGFFCNSRYSFLSFPLIVIAGNFWTTYGSQSVIKHLQLSGSCQVVVSQSSGSLQKVISPLLAVVRQLSARCQAVVSQFQAVVWQSSESCQPVVSQFQTVVSQLSESCQTVVRQLSGSH